MSEYLRFNRYRSTAMDNASAPVLWTNDVIWSQGYEVKDTIVYQDHQSALLLEKMAKSHYVNGHMKMTILYQRSDQEWRVDSEILFHQGNGCRPFYHTITRPSILK